MRDRFASVEKLSQRQIEVLREIGRHYRAKAAARALNISVEIVKTHTDEARRRLGVSSTLDAVRLVLEYDRDIPENGGAPEFGIPGAPPSTAPTILPT